jgi:hypothetical protein
MSWVSFVLQQRFGPAMFIYSLDRPVEIGYNTEKDGRNGDGKGNSSRGAGVPVSI